ncbi:MAG: peptide-methionine (S)-S-oxide reductase MsrA [Candidatus Magasanikbacteria bacterium]|nr:peptide-methionine (S)-S-oxide reductase MsrA [Candidatus Magasanikbacteria bacterium]
MEIIVFGGGCFWCTEAVFQMLHGIKTVTSGYTGGSTPNPTYEEVSTGNTGHVESIKVEYDPAVVSLRDLLAVFFTSHDPTTLNRQGNDVGTQYRSAIFYSSAEQKKFIESFIKELAENKTFSRPLVTEIRPLSVFYPAEDYHKNYYREKSDKPYCQFVIDPKIVKLRKSFSHLLKP